MRFVAANGINIPYYALKAVRGKTRLGWVTQPEVDVIALELRCFVVILKLA